MGLGIIIDGAGALMRFAVIVTGSKAPALGTKDPVVVDALML
jgi:hypothetical protein